MARRRRAATRASSITLSTDQEEVARIDLEGDAELESKLRRAAMAWSYRVRNRQRWIQPVGSSEVRVEQCREELVSLGIDEDALQKIANRGVVEVRVPYVSEEQGWAARILPWEFLLSTATRPWRPQAGLTVLRHLDRGDFTSRRSNSKAASIVSYNSKVQEKWDFTSEWELTESLYGYEVEELEQPTTEFVAEVLEREKPTVIHVGGVDVHQGAALLGMNDAEKLWDGMLFFDQNEEPIHVLALDLATTLGAVRPRLVMFNLHNSAARIAGLTVARGAEVAIGFQDVISATAAEAFISEYYRAWSQSDGDPVASFITAWSALGTLDESMSGTGVVLWSARSLVGGFGASRKRGYDMAYEFDELRRQPIEFASRQEARDGLDIWPDNIAKLNYALLHNRQPMFLDFLLTKTMEREGTIRDVRVEVELYAGKERLAYRSTESVNEWSTSLTDKVFVPLTSELTRSLEESLETGLRIKVSVGEHEGILEETRRVTLLPVNEWVDDDENRHFLPSFVFPGDPAVRDIVSEAIPYLRALADDRTAGFDGYQRIDWEDPEIEDPTACVDQQVSAIWSALLDRRIGYLNPPPTYTDSSQRLRTPSRILEARQGTCIDLALLLISCLEYIEVYPVMFLLNGHAFPGYWRSLRDWEDFTQMTEGLDNEGIELERDEEQPASDPGKHAWVFPKVSYSLIRRQVEQGSLVPLEAVWLTTNSSFGESQDDGWENLSSRSEFESMIDIAIARQMARPVTPIPLT